ncbi:MAG: tetratricopeptide repeat protein, partial [Myxococcota bacterium]
ALSVAADRATVEHALGLALVRLDRHDEALVHLSRAYALRPEYERFGYVYAIAAFERGRTDESLRVLETLHRRYPANADFLQLLVTYNQQLGRDRAAARYAAKLSALRPAPPSRAEP